MIARVLPAGRPEADEVVRVDCGFAVLSRRFAASCDHNRLIITERVGGPRAMRLADTFLGQAGYTHRLITVHGDRTAAGLPEELTAAVTNTTSA